MASLVIYTFDMMVQDQEGTSSLGNHRIEKQAAKQPFGLSVPIRNFLTQAVQCELLTREQWAV